MNSRDKNKQENPPKKPYRSPVLEVYGNIQAITKAVGTMSTTGDGSGMAQLKTA